MEIANFSIGKGPPCEYFQQILEVSFDFSDIFGKYTRDPSLKIQRGGSYDIFAEIAKF